MARGAGRPVHALPRHLVRRRRGRDAAGPPRADHVGPRVPHGAARRLRREGVGSVTRALPFPGDPPVTPQLVRDHNLTDEEYRRIEALLGRAPTFAELGVFSALWSEHCSYKHSRPILKTFPTAGPQVVQGPGENAGVLRLPGGWAVAFKIESHNHPSAVEPYQGAATGMGGILRDVFTMGARPVAVLNSLRFGRLDEARNRYLCAGGVKGVGDYGHCVAIQDMGAAGRTSSSAEMAAKGGVGVEIDLSLVPTREPGMTPYEILLSESQERMLVVARPDRIAPIQAIAGKWDLAATPIGRVTDDGMYRAKWQDQVVVEIPGQRLIDDCPVYTPEAREDDAIARLRAERPAPRSPLPAPAEVLLKLLDHPPIASKRWVYEQYDSTVQAGTVIGPGGGDAGVIRVRNADFGLAVTLDCNNRYGLLDPYEGGKAAVAEAARNIACTGARPLGITDCLNFGNPERPSVFHQFKESCRGIADACRALDTPVTGGNVSFYNESPAGAVDPTPVVGMVGLLSRVNRAVPSHARAIGDVVFVLGRTQAELGGSQFWEVVHGFVGGMPPRVDLGAERRLVDYLVTAADAGLLRSAHDCSQGGLGVALAEVAMRGPYDETGFGLDIDLTAYASPLAAHDLLFSESHGRAVVTCAPERATAVAALAQELGVPAQRVGTVGERGGALRVRLPDATVEHPVDRLRQVYFTALPRRMGD